MVKAELSQTMSVSVAQAGETSCAEVGLRQRVCALSVGTEDKP